MPEVRIHYFDHDTVADRAAMKKVSTMVCKFVNPFI